MNLIDAYINQAVHKELGKEVLQERKKIVEGEILRLRAIKQELINLKVVQQKIVSRRTALHYILGAGTSSGLMLKTDIFKENTQYMQKVGLLIFEAYELTSKVLQHLGVINPVRYVFTYTDQSNNFMRSEELQIDPQQDLTFEMHRKHLIIRLKESQIKHKLEQQKSKYEIVGVAKHYNDFVRPFQEAQNNSKKGWKVNWGIASEAFERHWEQLQHSLESPGVPEDVGSVGSRWILYRQSSGSDPYYTGPDTVLSQVKNANASIISNADTVLTTLAAILKIADTKVSSEQEAQLLMQTYQQAFTAKKNEVTVISNKMWEAIDKTAQAEIRKILGSTLQIK